MSEIINLNGEWSFGKANEAKRYMAKVPSCNFADLTENKVIEDPFYKKNESECQWVGDESWVYERTFNMSDESVNNSFILLHCDMLDTLCEVFVNGTLVGKGENCHIGYEFDIKNVIKTGENSVKIVFYSPVKYIKEMQEKDKTPRNCNGIDGAPHIRKPACHFGWDWGPCLPISGITRDISVVCFNERISDFSVEQVHNENTVSLKINAETVGNGKLSGFVTCPDGEKLPLSFDENTAEIEINNPLLWWTHELSDKAEQPLYTVTVNFGQSSKQRTIGLRTIELNRSEDEYGNNFQFILNGVPIFAKGSNWIPPDSLITRADKETIVYYIDTAVKANFNMLRTWGGGYYESEDFYSECDKRGILVWQDFCFACLMYPFYNEEFLNNVKNEIEYNVKRISSHPSLALWCGNNEIEFMFQQLPESMKIVQWYKKFFYEILPQELRKFDSITPFIETSPIGKGFRQQITKDNWGDTHMWHVWHGSKKLDYYRTRFTRFCSEYGMESLPSIDAVSAFATQEDFSLYSDVFLFHQKCDSGNGKMLFYLYEQYNKPEKLEDLIYFTQLIQMQCIREATEHWRRNKGRCNGSLWWQFNDCWGAPSWSSVDYTGKWKALQYASVHFNAPLTVSIEDNENDVLFYVLNDTLRERDVTLRVKFCDFNGKVIKKETANIPAKSNSTEFAMKLSLDGIKRKNTVIVATLFEHGEEIARKTKVLLPDRKLNLKKATITYTLEKDILTIKTDTFVRSVFIDIKDERNPLSDNFFDLLPGEEKKVKLPNENISEDRITIKTVANVNCDKSTFNRIKFRAAFSVKPINIGNRIYYSVS